MIPAAREATYQLALRFSEQVCEEITGPAGHLSSGPLAMLRTYYHAWLPPTALARRQAARRRYARRLSHPLELLLSLGPCPRVLDAGSGSGSDALLFALAGADVLGLDLRADRVATAQARISYYQRGKADLAVRFSARNLLRLEGEGPFDLIWVNEAISHIDPVGAFLEVVAAQLSPRGTLVIADANASYPLNHLAAYLARGRALHVRRADPETGEPISYAQERIFRAGQLGRRLCQAGLRVQAVHAVGYLPSALFTRFTAPLFARLDDLLSGVTLLRGIGISYLLIARHHA